MSAVSSSSDIPVCVECGTEEDKISASKKECTSCEQKLDDAPCELLNDMSIRYHADSISTCANCGKEGSDVKNTCNKCKLVKYCNAACKKKHRHKHKKECERYVAELHEPLEASISNTDDDVNGIVEGFDMVCISDDILFQDPPPKEDCPICMIPIPHDPSAFQIDTTYQPCCGKILCHGCAFAAAKEMDKGTMKRLCPYCRVPTKDYIKRCKDRTEMNDFQACYQLGVYFYAGLWGLNRDINKA